MRHNESVFWPKIVLVVGIIWGYLWLLAGGYHESAMNFICAYWAGLYADLLEVRR